MLVLGCYNYLRKTELFFKLNHHTQMLFFAVPKICVSGPAFLFFPFSIHGTTGRLAYLLYFLKTEVCATNSLGQDARSYVALKQS